MSTVTCMSVLVLIPTLTHTHLYSMLCTMDVCSLSTFMTVYLTSDLSATTGDPHFARHALLTYEPNGSVQGSQTVKYGGCCVPEEAVSYSQ